LLLQSFVDALFQVKLILIYFEKNICIHSHKHQRFSNCLKFRVSCCHSYIDRTLSNCSKIMKIHYKSTFSYAIKRCRWINPRIHRIENLTESRDFRIGKIPGFNTKRFLFQVRHFKICYCRKSCHTLSCKKHFGTV